MRRKDIRSLWGAPDVRGALRAMQGWVCAYCLKGFADGDEVEHFRPRRDYWWLAYDFSNYFLACHRCNKADVKGARFPLADDSPRVSFEHRHTLPSEARLLADPAQDPVDSWFFVDMGRDDLPVRARDELSANAARIARETIRLFRYNTDTELVQDRARCFVDAHVLLERGEVAALRARASRYSPQCATYRAFISLEGGLELPTAEEDLDGLLVDVVKRLRVDQRLRAQHGDDDRSTRLRDELHWLLAVLAADPPAYDRATMLARLEREGLRDVVDPLIERLTVSSR